MELIENKSARCLPWIVSFLFFASLWSLDFPKPYFDDLFFCGAGLNMAGGGDFSNPLIERQHFPGHYFFEQTPVHSYAIAGWMKIFGIGARSLTGFQEAMYLVMALATQSSPLAGISGSAGGGRRLFANGPPAGTVVRGPDHGRLRHD